MTQDELKIAVGKAAADHVAENSPEGCIIGVGTGSTPNCFIDALATFRTRLKGAIASSEATKRRLESHGIVVFDLNDIDDLPFYVDGADEIDAGLNMIKGGGGALTREKIVAAVARKFICIADGSKAVATLGRFPLPVEVIPMARAYVARELTRLGGDPVLREGFITDNGNVIFDVRGLVIIDPKGLESEINQMAGVVTNGLFAIRPADLLLLGRAEGVKSIF